MNRMGWVLILTVFFLAGCDNASEQTRPDRFDSGTIHISVDESFKPVIDAQIQVYEAQYPKAKIMAHYKAEADCLADFAVDSIRMVIATRGPSERERKFIVDSLHVGTESLTVAYDAIAVIVNPQSADSFFTIPQLRDLVGGKSNKNLIPVFDGTSATSTVRFMLDSVLRGQPLGKNVVAAQSSQGVIDYVARTKNAIGFLGISWIGNPDDTAQQADLRRVKLARLESTDSVGGYVLPVQYLIYSRTYPLIRDLVATVKEKHNGLAHAFWWFMWGEEGQLLFRRSFVHPARRGFYIRDTELQ